MIRMCLLKTPFFIGSAKEQTLRAGNDWLFSIGVNDKYL